MRVWALLGARAGDNNQVLALAEALGLPFEIKQVEYNSLRRLGPRLLGASLASLTSASRSAITSEPPPHLTLSVGHRSVAVVRALKRRSGGRIRAIHIGFPRVAPRWFDLVITTPQYPIADQPNVLRLPYSLSRARTAAHPTADAQCLAEFPAPRRLVIVGGPTLYWNIDKATLLARFGALGTDAREKGGSLLVTTSPRTPDRIRSALAAALSDTAAPTLFALPGTPPAYASLLNAADEIHVTADSVAMISDAIWTGKPLALIPIASTMLGRLAMTIANLRRNRLLYPRDLRAFWRALAEIGITERPAVPRTSPTEVMDAVLQRVRPILDHLCVENAGP